MVDGGRIDEHTPLFCMNVRKLWLSDHHVIMRPRFLQGFCLQVIVFEAVVTATVEFRARHRIFCPDIVRPRHLNPVRVLMARVQALRI